MGVVRSFGLFESLRTYDGRPWLLGAHLDRLWKAIRTIRWRPPVGQRALAQIIHRLIRKNGSGDLLIRMVLTGGPSSIIVPEHRGSVVVMVDPIHRFPSWQYKRGIRLMTTRYSRIIPEIKTTVYFPAVLESIRARRRGFTEVVYLDEKGAILEGSTFNVFAVLPGPRLVTPRDRVLAGVTGNCVIRLARRLKIPVKRHPIDQKTLKKAHELFITSSNRELIPAVRVDRQKIGNGQPGPVTQQLHREYRRMVREEINLSE
jgi:branched-chain amino acid aminotransferase